MQEAMPDREGRVYKATDLPTIREDAAVPADRRDLLLKLYEQTCTTWRMLVDVRFKLLALVPTVSLISLATVFGTESSPKYFSPKLRLLFAVLGLVATIGLLIYDLRNSQLHDDLISRGRKIEDELGVDTGIFRGRKVAKRLIKHDNATILIYGAALVSWISAIWIAAIRWS
jgi:hypothetical protein